LRYGLRAAAVAALLLGLSALSISRNHDYRSEIALWESTAKLSPNKSRPYNNLGYAYYLAGRNQEAERAYRTAIRLDPGNLRAQNNLARLKAHP
jgi:Flp pilus assembly protein TadD